MKVFAFLLFLVMPIQLVSAQVINELASENNYQSNFSILEELYEEATTPADFKDFDHKGLECAFSTKTDENRAHSIDIYLKYIVTDSGWPQYGPLLKGKKDKGYYTLVIYDYLKGWAKNAEITKDSTDLNYHLELKDNYVGILNFKFRKNKEFIAFKVVATGDAKDDSYGYCWVKE